jgi:histidinol-phosphate aminotransferase
MPEVRPAVLKMAPYSPPTGGREGMLRLDFNENTVGCSPAVIAFLKEKLSGEALSIYPEYGEAKREIAAYFDVREDELLFTNGTDEAIQVLVNTYVDDGQDVLILHPSYAMYRFYADVAGAAVREIEYRQGTLEFPTGEFLAAIRPDTKAILIANPNNPTGVGVGIDVLRRILDAAPQAAVLIDEAYFEFSGVTVLPWLETFPNLFVSRTFSKTFGLAAMRFGCLFSQAANVAYMRKAQSPYSVNAVATLAARAAVRDPEYTRQYVKEVLAAREMAREGFERLGIRYYPSQANFILFQAGERAIPIRDELRRRGVLIRDRSYEIRGCVRVTIGTREQVARFLKELESLW